MIVELIPAGGVGRGEPIRLEVTQVVVRQDNGTPIYAAAHYGPDGACAASSVNDADFQRILKVLGIDMTVLVSRLSLPAAPTGAKLLTGPTPR